jgi:carnitine-CoA ligase
MSASFDVSGLGGRIVMWTMPPVAERTMSAAYALALAGYPDKVAHIGDGREWTFADSHQRSLRVAGGLAALGLARLYTYCAPTGHGGLTAGDRALVTLPLFHLAGLGAMFGPLIAGCTCVLQPAFSPSKFWPFARAHGITSVALLGAMSEMLQQQQPRADDARNPLRIATMAPVPTNLDTFCRRFGIEATTAYGSSEIGCVMQGDPDDLLPGEAGKARPGYELRIVGPDGQDAPPGAAGELRVRPEEPLTVMQGYHNLPGKTAETIVDGWVRTGDAFRVDAGGHYFFIDRIKDALRRRGENISSFEVEGVVNEYPAVLESAVVAVPSGLSEDEIKVVIVPRDGHAIDPLELTEFLIERLPYFMVPRYVEFTDLLPKTPTQKVLKHLLREGGVDGAVWDREAAGIVLRRGGRRA